MYNFKSTSRWSQCLAVSSLAGLLLAGCESADNKTANSSPGMAAPASSTMAQPTSSTPAGKTPAQSQNIIRIKAGSADPVKDSEGNVWLADQGFSEGDTAQRPDIKIENTKNPMLYQSEHYSMSGFTDSIPNGKYLVKLHFAETYEGITGPGMRVFSVSVQGHEIKDIDPWAKAGGPMRPYIVTVPVEVTNGKLQITFTPNVENPEINAIEIDPQS